MKLYKKFYQTTLLVLTLYVTLPSQAQFYIKAKGGYSAAAGRTEIHSWGNDDVFSPLSSFSILSDAYESQGLIKIKALQESFGQGFSFGLEAGYMFTKYVGVALDGSMILSEDKNVSIIYGNFNLHETISTKLVTVTPSIILDAGRTVFSPYLSLGPAFGFSNLKENISGDKMGVTITYSNEVYGGVALGLSAGVGGRYVVSPSVSIFAEFKFTSLQYSPKYRKITSYTEDGKDKLQDKFPNVKSELGEETTLNSNTLATHPLPFSSAGVSLGVMCSFGQK